MKKPIILGLLFCYLTIFAETFLSAPGDLDTSFGTGGKVTTPSNSSVSFKNAVAVQPDGKIVVVAIYQTTTASNDDFFVVRYNANGTLDTTFDGDGFLRTNFDNRFDVPSDVKVQPDGKIVVVGKSGTSFTSGYDVAVARYNSDGSLDTTFDGDGKVLTPIGTANDEGNAVIIQPNGKIVVAGNVGVGFFDDNLAVVRYNSDGSLDTTFDGDGKAVAVANDVSFATDLVLQTDGKILVTSFATADGNTSFGLTRFNPDGSLDGGFDTDGTLSTACIPNNVCYSRAVALQSDGKILVAGYTETANDDFVLMRYNANGTLDTTFDGDGKVITQVGNADDKAYGLAVQQNGKILVGGSGSNGSNNDFALLRYNSNGSLDSSFGNAGKVTTPFGIGSDIAFDLVLQNDGKVVLAGYQQTFAFEEIAVARYQGDAVLSSSAKFDFNGDGRDDISIFRGDSGNNSGTWYVLNSPQGTLSVNQFGLANDRLAPADFDGDGKTDYAVFRNGVWYILNSSNSSLSVVQFGLSGDVPVSADYDADNKADPAVFRQGAWYILQSGNGQTRGELFGLVSDKPLVGDFDGDGKSDLTVFRDGTWYVLRSTQGFTAFQFGIVGDKPAPADYDGDRKTDAAIYRDGTWYLLRSNFGFTAFQFGIVGDKPVPADYDGDGKADAAIYRDGAWYVLSSSNGTFYGVLFGFATDKPIPASYLP